MVTSSALTLEVAQLALFVENPMHGYIVTWVRRQPPRAFHVKRLD